MPMPDHGEPAGLHSASASRRGLLAVAAGGFITVGSGLLVPGTAEATRKAERRKKRRRRDRNDKPRGSVLNPVTFHVQNMTGLHMEAVFWDQKDEVSSHAWFKSENAALLANPGYSTDDSHIAHHLANWPGTLLWIANPGIMVSAVNEVFRTPLVTVGREGNVSGSDGWTNGTTEFAQRMDEGQIVMVSNRLPFKVKIQRNTDKDARKIYAITLDDRL